MRVLITGGHGFIGGRLAVHLARSGRHVVLGSRRSRKSPNWLSDVETVVTAWNDARSLESICTGIDVVVHAAGMTAQDCEADPISALEFNGVATQRLARAAASAGVKRFIYISTAHVYANPLVGRFSEDSCPTNLHPYATSHLAGEKGVLRASQESHMEGVVVRLSNSFGLPVDRDANCWKLLVNDLCRQIVETGRMVLHSSGDEYRNFVAMQDVCDAIAHLACDVMLPPTESDIFNVGSGSSNSVLEMAALIQQRARTALGFEATLVTPKPAAKAPQIKLDYRTDKLAAVGVTVKSDFGAEVDALLASCRSWFSTVLE